MSGRGPGLDRASGSFRHSERYAATAARYSRALERERNAEEIARDGGGATSKDDGERESLLETPDYLERQRARNDSFKRGCGRMLIFVLVLAVFGAVAAVGFDYFGRNTVDSTPSAPTPATTDSKQSGRTVNDRPTARAARYSPPPLEREKTPPEDVPAPSPEKKRKSSSESKPAVETEQHPPTASENESAPKPKPKPKPEVSDEPAPKPEPKATTPTPEPKETSAPKPKPKPPTAAASKGEPVDEPTPKPAPKPPATPKDEPTLSKTSQEVSSTHQAHERESPSTSKDKETSDAESDADEEAAAVYRSLSETAQLADSDEADDTQDADDSARISASEDAATFEALLLMDEAVRRETHNAGGLGSAFLAGQKQRLVREFQAS